MSGEKKSIIINKNYLTTGKSKKKKPKINNLLKGVSMKNKLLKDVKKHHNKSLKTSLQEKSTSKINSTQNIDSLDDSINYLENIIQKKKEKVKKQKIKREQENQNNLSSVVSQTTLQTTPVNTIGKLETSPPIHLDNPIGSFSLVNNSTLQNNQVHKPLKKAPPFGILKGGTKPTYRQYYKIQSKSMKNPTRIHNSSHSIKPLVIQQGNQPITKLHEERKQKLKTYINDYNKTNVKDKIKNKKKIKLRSRKIKKTRRLGKNKSGKVGILIKDLKTRKNIEKEHNILKKIPINKIRSYLQKHGLIKTGSNAPDYVLRKIYEDSFLSGDIYNISDDVLVHNYLNTM